MAQVKIIAFMGSYHTDGIIAQSVSSLTKGATEAGAEVETIVLKDADVEFCTNCRACTQESGTAPGHCPLRDEMSDIVQKMENAHGFIFGSPTNMGTMNAITKRFMERLVCYAYWPYGALAPKLRKSVTKMAVGVTSSAMPGVMARFSCKTGSLLKSMARITGSKMLKVHYLGLKGKASGELLTTAERNSMFKQGKDLATKLQANL